MDFYLMCKDITNSKEIAQTTNYYAINIYLVDSCAAETYV